MSHSISYFFLIFIIASVCLIATEHPVYANDVTTNNFTDAASQLRDPFWPVGYMPEKTEPQPGIKTVVPKPKIASEDDWKQAEKKLIVSSILKSKNAAGEDLFHALINGKIVSPGDIVTTTLRDFTFYFKTTSISTDGVKFTPLKTEPK